MCAIIANPNKNIHGLLEDFSRNDIFMMRLLQVSKAFDAQRKRGEPVQDIHCVILRSDYMIDQPTRSIKLVEYNTIATGFCPLANKVNEVHKYVLDKYGDRLPLNYGLQEKLNAQKFNHRVLLSEDTNRQDMSFSNQVASMIEGLAHGIKLYKEAMGDSYGQRDPWILFVCEDDERNLCDQKLIEMQLQRDCGIFSIRKTFLEVAFQADFDERSKKLSVDGREIGLVYYRTGYQAEHYMIDGDSSQEWDERKWQARQLLECSLAIKCPSIDLHLSTFKKFQQSFSDETMLNEVMGSER